MKTVIVGAGQAGAWLARGLRQHLPCAPIVLLGQEPYAPYERPPLSKAVLSGEQAEPPCLLSVEQARELGIDLRLGVQALAIDRDHRRVVLARGEPLAYDRLVLATGGSARKPAIPGSRLDGVYTLRGLDDARRLRAALRPGRRLLVVGGGWIGLEVAACARRLGLEVTLIESGPRLCARSVPAIVSDFLLDLHGRAGVDVQLGGAVTAIERSTSDDGLRAYTHRGTQEADLIVFGIGLAPDTALASACGLAVDNGIMVDTHGRTSDPDIYAVGDVANQPCAWQGAPAGARLRLESWANAQNQALAVAAVLAGREPTRPGLPWFWSDQYDINLQVLGLPTPSGQHILRGSVEDKKFCLFQRVDQRLHSVIAVNMAKELKLAKRWHKEGRCPDAAQLQDLSCRLDRL